MTNELTCEILLAAYESNGVEGVCKVCEPYKLPVCYCEDCDCLVPLWGKVCAVCWQGIPIESE